MHRLPSRNLMKSTAATETRRQILDCAEQHFALYGFAGTSLRQVIKEANVNVAAIAYHYGTKEDLFAAVIERFAQPVVSEQLAALAHFEEEGTPTVEEILRAFYTPPLALVQSMGERATTLSLFLGRCQTEPDPIYSMVDKHFSTCRQKFVKALSLAVPDLPQSAYEWRFEFMLSLIVCFLTRNQFIFPRYRTSTDWDLHEVLNMLITFCAPGMRS